MFLQFAKDLYHKLLEKKKEEYLLHLKNKGLVIGKNVRINEGFFFDPSHCYLISIGDNCTFAPNVRLIAHDASTKMHLGYSRIGKIIIENNCFLGDSVIVLPKVTIGNNSIIAAGSIVTKDVLPMSIAAGNPCKVIGTLDIFKNKHEQCISRRLVPFSELDQEALSNKQREEILRFLGTEIGYVR